MSEISPVGSEELAILPVEVEEQKDEQPVAQETASNPSATQARMAAEESLQVAITPNLRQMSRAEEILRRLNTAPPLSEKFDLLTELFAIDLGSYRASGGDIEKFVQPFKENLLKKGKEAQQFLEGLGQAERSLFSTYNKLAQLLHDLNCREHLALSERLSEDPYRYYALELMKLEETLNCPILGIELARKQLSYFAHRMPRKLNTREGREFYWKALVPGFHQCLTLLEGKTEKSFLIYFKLLLHDGFVKFYPWSEEKPDLVELFFPLLLRYNALELLKGRFEERHKDLPAWETAFQWVELHVKAAKFLAPTDSRKAIFYLDEAQMLTEETLWGYPMISSEKWNEKREEALAMIAEAKI